MKASKRRDLLPRIYLRTEPQLRRVLGLVKGVFDGVWLGLLTQAQLDALDALVYDRRANYTDDNYNRKGLWRWERTALDRHFADRGRIVVTGAGGGREVLALLRLGYDAIGFECNDQLAAAGAWFLAREGHPGRLLRSPRHRWPPEAGRCAGVIVGWGSYMHMPGRERRVHFLREARTHLPPGAPILVSFWTTRGLTAYMRTVAAVGSALRRMRRRPRLAPGDALATSFVHFFTKDEIFDELRDGGFEPVAYDDADYGMAVGLVAGAATPDRNEVTGGTAHEPTISR